MARATIKLAVKVHWWVPHYIAALGLFCRAFGTEPDVAKVAAFIVRYGIAIRITSAPADPTTRSE